jgi:hypothetical protein
MKARKAVLTYAALFEQHYLPHVQLRKRSSVNFSIAVAAPSERVAKATTNYNQSKKMIEKSAGGVGEVGPARWQWWLRGRLTPRWQWSAKGGLLFQDRLSIWKSI